MNQKGYVFQCDICGNLVCLVKKGKGELVCCGEKMIYMKAKTGDPSSEKHIPVFDKKGGHILVKVGTHPHPMVKSHFVGFIDAEFNDFMVRKELGPGEKPELVINTDESPLALRSYCLIHGVFQSKKNL